MSAAVIAPAAALEVAATLAFGIARRAFWSGERCTWLEALPVEPHQNPAVSASAGPDVYGGVAGIGWFLAEAAARTGDALLHRTSLAALRQAEALAVAQLRDAPHGFYGGAAGTAAVLVAAGGVLGDQRSVAAGRALLLRLPLAAASQETTDVIGGLAGTLLALVLAAVRGDERGCLVERAGEVAQNLIAMGERGEAGTLSWRTMAGARGNLAGFAHGAGGIAHALLVLDALAPDRALREAAAAAFAYERTLFDPERGGWPDLRDLEGYAKDQIFFPVAWCHGAAGITASRLAAAAAGFDVAAELEAGLAASVREAQRALGAPNPDFTLCHGVLGLADLLVDALRAGRAEAAAPLAAIVSYAVSAFHEAERPWPSGLISREEISGLMLGNAGIGHFFLRLADPALESVLVPGAALIAGCGGRES